MTGRIPARVVKLAATALTALVAFALAATSASATQEVVYNDLPATNPGNVVSQAYEATQLGQFGGEVEVAGKFKGSGGGISFGMSSWGCQRIEPVEGENECVTTPGAKFELPVTLSINAVGPGNSVGTLLQTVTRTVKIPYRPSQNDKQCGFAFKGEWYDAHLHSCFHGLYTTITIPTKPTFIWPAQAIVSLAFNTSDYGVTPQRPQPCNSTAAGCPYDSLNVGLIEAGEKPSIGEDPFPTNAYQNSTTPGNYCDGGLGGTGVFRLDAGCWEGYQPMIRIKATA